MQINGRWMTWTAFAAFCVLVSTSWWLPPGTNDGPSSIEKQSCFYAVAGLAALAVAYRHLLVRLRKSDLVWLQLAGTSVLLFGVPAVASEWAQRTVPSISQAALFALVPFVVVVVAMGREPLVGEEFAVRRFFAPALIGFGGTLFLLPFSFPASVSERAMFGVVLAAVVVVGFASVWIYRLLRGFGMLEAFAVVCLSNAVFLVFCGLVSGGSWSGALSLVSLSSLYNLLELALLVWLLRELSPVRLAARYLMVPLLLVLEGLAVLRPAFTARIAAGLVLLLGGAGYVLFSRGRNSDAVLSIR